MDFDGRKEGGALSFSSRVDNGEIEGEIAGDKATVLGALLGYSDGVFGANGTSVGMMLAWINSLRRSCLLIVLSVRSAVRNGGTVSGAFSNSDVIMMFKW